jgi:hypothetical protein
MGHPHLKAGTWLLKTSITGKNCLAQYGGNFNTPIGTLTCLSQRFYDATAQETQWYGGFQSILSQTLTLVQFPPPPTGIEQGWHRHRMVGPRRIILDMWKYCLYQRAPVLGQGQGLCARDNTSFLFPPPLTSKCTAGNSSLWGKQTPKESEGYTKEYTNWKMERWLMAPREHNSVL